MSDVDMEEMAAEAELSANGSSIEDMATDEEELAAADEHMPPVPGSATQLSLLAGGEEPTSASMKLRGGSIPLEGEFEKGDHIRLVVECRVAEVHFVDNIDRSGYVLGAERRHIARIDSVQRA
jgi:hypothetical protein